MAKFLTDIDLRQNQLLQAVIQNLATAPSNPKVGQVYYNTTSNKFCVYENNAWVEFVTAVEFAEYKNTTVAELAKKVDSTVYEAKVKELQDAIDTKVAQSDYDAKMALLDAEDAKKVNKTDYDAKVAELEKADADEKTAREALAKNLADNYYTKSETYTQEVIDQKIAEKDSLPAQAGQNGKFLTTDGSVASWASVTKETVGLANVDNTSDADKPVSTAQQAALDLKADKTTMAEELAKKADKATTLAGYGITDAYTQTQINDALSLKADKQTTYTKTEVDGIVDGINNTLDTKADKSDTYTKAEVDAKVASVYRFKGSVETVDALPKEGNVEGDVYNVKATGENYAWVAPVGETAGYWDDLGGDIDLTPYLTKAEAQTTYETIANVNALASRLDTKDGELQDAIDTKVAQSDYDAKVEELEEAIANTAKAAVHKEVVANPELAPVNGVATWTIAHNIESADVDVVIKESATSEVVYADVVLSGEKQVTIKMNSASTIAADTYKAIILG